MFRIFSSFFQIQKKKMNLYEQMAEIVHRSHIRPRVITRFEACMLKNSKELLVDGYKLNFETYSTKGQKLVSDYIVEHCREFSHKLCGVNYSIDIALGTKEHLDCIKETCY